MEAHYGKLSIIAIFLIVAMSTANASYSLDRNVGQASLRARLCPEGYVSLAHHYKGYGASSSTVVKCYKGDNVVVPQVGRSFKTYQPQEIRSRFLRYDRFRSPAHNARVRG